ncbi:uncharacterized protein METZ01_LOCUS458294, partial [marine metagenome]
VVTLPKVNRVKSAQITGETAEPPRSANHAEMDRDGNAHALNLRADPARRAHSQTASVVGPSRNACQCEAGVQSGEQQPNG